MRNLILANSTQGNSEQQQCFSGCQCAHCLKQLSAVTGIAYLPCQYCPDQGLHTPCNHGFGPTSLPPPESNSGGQTTSYVQLIPADSYVIAYNGNPQLQFVNSSYHQPQYHLVTTTQAPQMYHQEFSMPVGNQVPIKIVDSGSYSCTHCGLTMGKHEVASHTCQSTVSAQPQMITAQPTQYVNVHISQEPQQVFIQAQGSNVVTNGAGGQVNFQYVQQSPASIMPKLATMIEPIQDQLVLSRPISKAEDFRAANSVSILESKPSVPEIPSSAKSNDNSANASKLPFQCDICRRRFRALDELEKHCLDHEEKPFKCDVCSKAFRQRRNLARHARTHSEVKPFVCTVCGWAFRRKSNLAAHERIHSGSKPFVCDDCGKSFRQKGSLSSHLRTHTKEKPHECSMCGDLFTRKGSLQRHMARFHPEVAQSVSLSLSSKRSHDNGSVSSESNTTHRDFEDEWDEMGETSEHQSTSAGGTSTSVDPTVTSTKSSKSSSDQI